MNWEPIFLFQAWAWLAFAGLDVVMVDPYAALWDLGFASVARSVAYWYVRESGRGRT